MKNQKKRGNRKMPYKYEKDRVAYRRRHRKKAKKYNKKYRSEHYEEFQAGDKKRMGQIKSEVYAAYGDECSCCGETNSLFFQIDHIEGGGTKHRKKVGGSMYRWLRKNNFPAGFQILCANCHIAKHRKGVCHERYGN